MAATFKPIDAFDLSKSFLKGMPLDKVQVRLLDTINKIIWMAAPWRWSVGTMPTATMVSDTSDYTIVAPADFLFLQEAYITDGAFYNRELIPTSFLPTTVGKIGQPNFISHVTGNTFRVGPKPGTVSGTQTLVSLYKKTAPTLTASSLHTAGALIMDDEWFWVYESGVLWMAYLYGDDQRAGGAQVDPKGDRITFTGQRAVFEANLEQMKSREKLAALNYKTADDRKDDQ